MVLAQLEVAEVVPPDRAAHAARIEEQWAALPALHAAWEEKIKTRRDAALHALADEAAAEEYSYRIEDCVASRREGLVQLEMTLGLETPAEFQAQRLAVKVSKLRERFKSAATASAGTAVEQLVQWCALPGLADAGDRRRCESVFAAIERGH